MAIKIIIAAISLSIMLAPYNASADLGRLGGAKPPGIYGIQSGNAYGMRKNANARKIIGIQNIRRAFIPFSAKGLRTIGVRKSSKNMTGVTSGRKFSGGARYF